MFETLLLFIVIFLLGASFGSFFNVLIDRLPRGLPIVISRSHCEHCKKELAWQELFPIFSYLVLHARCRYCNAHIPVRLFIVETLTGFLFLGLFIYFLPSIFYPQSINNFLFSSSSLPLLELLLYVTVYSCLIIIFFSDLEYGIIPDQILIVMGAAVIVLHIFFSQSQMIEYAVVGVASFLFFLAIFMLTRGHGMGFGDVKFSFLIGFLLGFPTIIVALYTAFLTGAFISLILILWGKKKLKKDTIAFGPFLVIGIVIAMLFGDRILSTIFPFL